MHACISLFPEEKYESFVIQFEFSTCVFHQLIGMQGMGILATLNVVALRESTK